MTELFERGRLLVRRARRCSRENLEQFRFVEQQTNHFYYTTREKSPVVFLCPEGGGFHDPGALFAQRCGLFLLRSWCADGHHFLRSHRGTKRRVRVLTQIPGQRSALWAYHQGMHRQGKAQRHRRRPGIPHLPHHETLKRHRHDLRSAYFV